MQNIARTLSESARVLPVDEIYAIQPAIFLPIGSPALLIEDSEARTFIRELGMKYNVSGRRPACIICFSARWISHNEKIQIMSNPHPQTVHDFTNFADCLYEIVYSAEGDVECAAKVAEALSEVGLEWEFDGSRGYDFGCWSPVALLFPDASVPLIQVSLHSSLDPNVHIAIGKALRPLREEGYLLLCLGGVTHNLLELSFSQMRPLTWAQVVDDWVADVLLAHNSVEQATDDENTWQIRNQRLATYDKSDMLMKSIVQAHPTSTYLLPLHVAAGSGGGCTLLHRSWIYSNLSMSSYMFGKMPDRATARPESPKPSTVAKKSAAADAAQQAVGQSAEPGAASDGATVSTAVGNLNDSDDDPRQSPEGEAPRPPASAFGVTVGGAGGAGGGGVDVSEVAVDLEGRPGSRPRTSSRPASRQLVALAAASARPTDSQRFAQQIQVQLGVNK